MDHPALVKGLTAAQYRERFERMYCRGPIMTFDGIAVRFRRRAFNHAFFESSRRDGGKDVFSVERAERMDWIAATLQDPEADLYVGYDKRAKSYDRTRRVAVVNRSYIVVIRLTESDTAEFVTAFVADPTPPRGQNLSTLDKIRMGPRWPLKNQ